MAARSLANLERDINDMERKLDNIIDLADNIGNFGDGPQVRADIENETKPLTPLSQSIKNTITQLQQQNSANLAPYERKFTSLSDKMQVQLPSILKSMQDHPLSNSTPLTQQQIEEDNELIEEISIAIDQICKTMKEIKEITLKTHAELEKQHHVIGEIDKSTTAARESVIAGNNQILAAGGTDPPKKKGFFSRFKK